MMEESFLRVECKWWPSIGSSLVVAKHRKRPTPGPPDRACFVLCKPLNSTDDSYARERQRKSITCIHREIIKLYEQALTHGHRAVWEAREQRHPFPPCTSPYAPPRHPNTLTQKLALVQARHEDINIGLRHPVPNEQAKDCTGSVEATGRESRRHDAKHRVHDMLHTRNQYRRTAAAYATATSGRGEGE